MNFVEPGGVTVATVALPSTLYAGTDFATGILRRECESQRLAEQDARTSPSSTPATRTANRSTRKSESRRSNAAEERQRGSSDQEMEMTSEFAGNATRQTRNAVLPRLRKWSLLRVRSRPRNRRIRRQEGIEPVNRDEVFARLEKILATVKIRPVAQEQVAQSKTCAGDSGVGAGAATTCSAEIGAAKASAVQRSEAPPRREPCPNESAQILGRAGHA